MLDISSTAKEREKGTQLILNAHVEYIIANAAISELTATDSKSNTELDSHANMVVLGRRAVVLNPSGKTVQVSPFTPEYD